MAGMVGIANQALSFLKQQRLDATPENYAIAYYFTAGSNPDLSNEIRCLLADGLRVTQIAASDMIVRHRIGLASSDDSSPMNAAQALRHQALRLADITQSQTEATSTFGEELAFEMSKMAEVPTDVKAVISVMIERAAFAERQLAAAAAETDRLREDLDAARADAHSDALTGLPNRRAAEAILAELEEENRPRIIAFCDIDRFKRINDTYGHAVGDRVLKAVALLLGETCRGRATVARWGGEEFVIIFKGTDMADAAAVVEAAREALTRKEFKLRTTDEPMGMVSFSAGMAYGKGAIAPMIMAADALLYQAKDEGRNRIITPESAMVPLTGDDRLARCGAISMRAS
jgi:diguanylate cyclase